jgi:hypothetical protein
MGIFVRLDPLLCQLQAIVFALEVNQIISKVSESLAEDRVEGGSKEWIDSAFEMHEKRGGVCDPIQQSHTGIRRWEAVSGIAARRHGGEQVYYASQERLHSFIEWC